MKCQVLAVLDTYFVCLTCHVTLTFLTILKLDLLNSLRMCVLFCFDLDVSEPCTSHLFESQDRMYEAWVGLFWLWLDFRIQSSVRKQ